METPIADSIELLDLMMEDMQGQKPLYLPGPYWRRKGIAATRDIRRLGLSQFRSDRNSIGQSCVDKLEVDVRTPLNYGLRGVLGRLLRTGGPIGRAFDGQVRQTRRIVDDGIRERAAWISASADIRRLLDRYQVPHSIAGGCTDFTRIDGVPVANHYLSLLESIHLFSERVDFSAKRTLFEIGGGFGANLHLMLTNFPGIRKVVYLDIPPNLYIGTQYLRAHFPSAVVDYRSHRHAERIGFAANDELEILCIAPWQIEHLDVSVDHFHNANSMVEMPEDVVQNYAEHVSRLLGPTGSISLTSYEEFDLATTIHPDRLPGFFGGGFEGFRAAYAATPHRSYYHFIRTMAAA